MPWSTASATRFVAKSKAELPTTLRVGSSGSGVRGSSDGRSVTPPPTALTKPWLERMVPSATPGSTRTSKTTVATLLVVADASARRKPGVAFSGAWSWIPATSGELPPGPSGTAAPFSVVLPATYWVFAGTASRSTASTASALPTFLTVIV